MENTHRVVARFDEADEARQAMVDLEVKGIDADAIHITTPPAATSKATVHEADLDVLHGLERRTLVGGVLGMLIGAVVVTAAVLLFVRGDTTGTLVVLGAIGGAFGGGGIGAYWGAISRLPANEEAFDPMVVGGRKSPEIVLEVRIDDPYKEADTMNVLRRHHAQKIEREVA